MLSKHPEACRFPHGHTRRIEIVVSAEALDENDMVCDFKALKLALGAYVARYDHAMAVNSTDPLLPAIREVHPKSLVVFEGHDPTTEVIADDLFRFVSDVLREGFEGEGYRIPPGRIRLDRVRVWETPNSWAEAEA